MEQFNLDELKKDLAALDAGDKLTESLGTHIQRIKNMDKNELIKTAMGAMMGGNLSLEGIGLPCNLFEQLETLSKINNTTRAKYRATVTARINSLESVEEAEVVNHG